MAFQSSVQIGPVKKNAGYLQVLQHTQVPKIRVDQTADPRLMAIRMVRDRVHYKGVLNYLEVVGILPRRDFATVLVRVWRNPMVPGMHLCRMVLLNLEVDPLDMVAHQQVNQRPPADPETVVLDSPPAVRKMSLQRLGQSFGTPSRAGVLSSSWRGPPV